MPLASLEMAFMRWRYIIIINKLKIQFGIHNVLSKFWKHCFSKYILDEQLLPAKWPAWPTKGGKSWKGFSFIREEESGNKIKIIILIKEMMMA